MAENSAIEWTDHTFNPWIGCTEVSKAAQGGGGCDNCYARVLMQDRYHKVQWGPGKPRVRTSEANWRMPIKWDKAAAAAGRRDRVFCASLADVFDNEVPDEWRRDLMRLIASTQNLDWLLLTKRIGNAGKMLADTAATFGMTWGEHWRNVWLGATVVNQEEADRDIPKLLAVPAAKRFLSMEPLLGPVDVRRYLGPQCDRGSVPGPGGVGGVTCRLCDGYGAKAPATGCRGIDWVIVGGESGHKARDFDIGWCRSIVAQCKAAGVACFVKQMGDKPCWSDDDEDSEPPHWGRLDYGSKGKDIDRWPADLRVREVPHG